MKYGNKGEMAVSIVNDIKQNAFLSSKERAEPGTVGTKDDSSSRVNFCSKIQIKYPFLLLMLTSTSSIDGK